MKREAREVVRSNNNRQRRQPQHQRSSVDVDVESLLKIENHCVGCVRGQRCCCSTYEVCVTSAEMKRIIKYLPEAAKLCPHLLTIGGYDNVFEPAEPGLYSIDTTEDGVCLFAYWSNRRIHCSLHTVAIKLGLPLAEVKPKVCLLWPMHFSDGDEVLGMISDAFLFACNSRKAPGSRTLSPGFVEVLDLVYGTGCGIEVQHAAEQGERRWMMITRKT